jgi:hypothetical protein
LLVIHLEKFRLYGFESNPITSDEQRLPLDVKVINLSNCFAIRMDEDVTVFLARPSVTANRVRNTPQWTPHSLSKSFCFPAGLNRLLYDQAIGQLSSGSSRQINFALRDLTFLTAMKSPVSNSMDRGLIESVVSMLSTDITFDTQSCIFSFLSEVLCLHPQSLELF